MSYLPSGLDVKTGTGSISPHLRNFVAPFLPSLQMLPPQASPQAGLLVWLPILLLPNSCFPPCAPAGVAACGSAYLARPSSILCTQPRRAPGHRYRAQKRGLARISPHLRNFVACPRFCPLLNPDSHPAAAFRPVSPAGKLRGAGYQACRRLTIPEPEFHQSCSFSSCAALR